MAHTAVDKIVRSHSVGDEEVKAALTAYVGLGFKRIILGVTDRRVLAAKTPYGSIKDNGLLWADPLDEVALSERATEFHYGSVNTGNTYLKLRRAGGSTLRLNPRAAFVGETASATGNVELLYSLIPGRF